MCIPETDREAHREKERQELPKLSLQDLVDRAYHEWERAGWESAEDFSELPNHPHVRLGWVLDELKRRAGI